MSTRIGCSGWSYADWVGPFYPKDTRPQDYLRLYSRVFDCVEIDSTFYRAPSPIMVQQWTKSSPPGFIFAPKLPKRITHDQHLENVESYLDHFTKTLTGLEAKLGPFVVQLPPSFKYPKHEKALTNFVTNVNKQHRYAIEFRNKSWFGSGIERLLERNNVCQVWSVNQYLSTPATVTSDFVFLRLVGDRAINQFNKVQKDQGEVMKNWSRALKEVGDSVKERFVFFNNHFAGFGPGSANEFRRLMGLVELDWSTLEGPTSQKTLFDFSKK
jgi:uncharacterized protein YecE (DUF72 family)